MDDLIKALDELFAKPLTKRRVVAWSVILALIAGVALIYEHYTAAFKIGRLQKAADLLTQLQQLESQDASASGELRQAREALLEHTLEVISATPPKGSVLPSTLRPSLDSLWKFLAGSVVWLLAGLLQFDKWKSKTGRKEIGEQVILALAAGFGATLLPAIWWPWFHLLVYPNLVLGGLALLLIPIAVVRQATRKARQKAESISCMNNLKSMGLAARTWATDQGRPELPQDFSAMKPFLASPQMLCCPANRKVRYELLSPGASEADPSVVYVKCPAHDLALLTDGSVQQLGDSGIVRQNGIWRIRQRASVEAADDN